MSERSYGQQYALKTSSAVTKMVPSRTSKWSDARPCIGVDLVTGLDGHIFIYCCSLQRTHTTRDDVDLNSVDQDQGIGISSPERKSTTEDVAEKTNFSTNMNYRNVLELLGKEAEA